MSRLYLDLADSFQVKTVTGIPNIAMTCYRMAPNFGRAVIFIYP